MIRGSDPGRVSYSPLPDLQTSSEFHQSSYLMGNGAISSRVKRPGRKADYSLLSNAPLKMGGDLHSFSLICLHVECRENFTFTLHLNCEKFIILISNGEGEDVPVHALKNYTGTEDSLI